MKISAYASTLIVAVGGIFLLFLLKDFLIPIVLGAFFGFLFDMLGKKISISLFKKDNSKGIGITLLVLSVVLVFVFVGFLGIYLEANFDQFVAALQSSVNNIKEYLFTISYISESTITTLFEKTIGGFSLTSFNGLVGTTFGFLLNAILVIVYAILFIVYNEKIGLLLELLIPGEDNDHLKVIRQTVYDYARGLLTLVIVVAILYAIGLGVIGVQYALLIALGSAFMTLVPTVGTFIGGMGAITATGLLTGSIWKAGFVAIWYVVIQTLEEYLILPKVVGKKVELNVFATIISIVAWGMIWGVAGVFLAIPIMGVLAKLLEKQKNRYSALLE